MSVDIRNQYFIFCNPFLQTAMSTIEDIYVASIETDRGQKEKIYFYDTAGLVSNNQMV